MKCPNCGAELNELLVAAQAAPVDSEKAVEPAVDAVVEAPAEPEAEAESAE